MAVPASQLQALCWGPTVRGQDPFSLASVAGLLKSLFLSNVPPPSVPHNNSCQWALGSSQGLCRTRCDLDRICLLGDDPLSAAGVGTEQEEAGIHQSWLPSGHLWPQGCCPLVAPAEVGGGLLPSSERHCAGWVEMSHRPPPPASAQWNVVADCPQCPVRAPPL